MEAPLSVQQKNELSREHLQKLKLNLTRELKHQNEYTRALLQDLANFAFSEEKAPLHRGRWRSEVFSVNDNSPVDVEIGTGNGTHFANYCFNNSSRSAVGIEIKYKPLIQTIRRCLEKDSKNARVCRYQALSLEDLFEKDEINNIFLFFPDPWVSPRKPQNRFFKKENLRKVFELQRQNSELLLKTDSSEYFFWAQKEVEDSPYELLYQTEDLHASSYSQGNFVTQFESIFLKQGLPIYSMKLKKT